MNSFQRSEAHLFAKPLGALPGNRQRLVVFTALVGLLVAPVGVHPMVGFTAILFIAVGAGASGALNMWYDADIDAVMKRTAKRPIPSGRVEPGEALAIGLGLSGISVVMLALATNLVAAGLLAFTILFYVVIYTIGLKRWTPQNIVIGGAAGALPPLIGWWRFALLDQITGDENLTPIVNATNGFRYLAFNLRRDPFERAQHESAYYHDWWVNRAYLLVPAQAYVGGFLATFKEYPPRQKAASFSLDQVMEMLTETAGAQ